MLRLLQILFLGHVHKWVIIKEIKLDYVDTGTEGMKIVQQCEVCGTLATRKIQ